MMVVIVTAHATKPPGLGISAKIHQRISLKVAEATFSVASNGPNADSKFAISFLLNRLVRIPLYFAKLA